MTDYEAYVGYVLAGYANVSTSPILVNLSTNRRNGSKKSRRLVVVVYGLIMLALLACRGRQNTASPLLQNLRYQYITE